jgi:hypothetical protein
VRGKEKNNKDKTGTKEQNMNTEWTQDREALKITGIPKK